MKPYGWEPGVSDTGECRPRSGTRESRQGGSYDMSGTEIARIRRRLKKRARQSAKQESTDE